MKRLNGFFRSVAAGAVLFVPLGLFMGDMAVASAQDAQQAVQKTILSAQQLDNLVAPLALYPDPLLSQVLVAATYPLEVVQANQWLQQNRQLTGTALIDAAKTQNWDPSVQALVAFPDVLTRLNQDVQWTTDLGNAFLAQQSDVMGAVQRLRARAQANGKLKTTPQEIVTNQTQDGQTAIAIQPADPQVIYVPTYDPAYVWGPPAYGYYPSLFYPTYGFGFGFGIPIGGFYLGWGGWGGWGWGPNWFGHSVYINGGFFHGYGYGYRGGYGYAGSHAWSHDYARSSRAVGASAGYSRSYSTAATSRAGGANGFRSGGAGQANRGNAGSSFNRAGAGNSYANRGAAGSSYANRGAAGNSYANRGSAGSSYANRGAYAGQSGRSYSAPARSYSAPAQRSYSGGQSGRSYSAPSAGRSYSAPSHAYSGGGGGSRMSSGGGGGGSRMGGGGGGSHGGGRR